MDLQPCRRQRIVWVLPSSAKLLTSRPLLLNLKRERPANWKRHFIWRPFNLRTLPLLSLLEKSHALQNTETLSPFFRIPSVLTCQLRAPRWRNIGTSSNKSRHRKNDQEGEKNLCKAHFSFPLKYVSALGSLIQRTNVLQTAKFGNSTPPSKLWRLSWWGLVVKQLLSWIRIASLWSDRPWT